MYYKKFAYQFSLKRRKLAESISENFLRFAIDSHRIKHYGADCQISTFVSNYVNIAPSIVVRKLVYSHYMFIRKQIKNGKTYFSLTKTFRRKGKVLQIAIGLGTNPSIMETHYKTRGPHKKHLRLTNADKDHIYKMTSELNDEYEMVKKERGSE